jgi:hypothetical protein
MNSAADRFGRGRRTGECSSATSTTISGTRPPSVSRSRAGARNNSRIHGMCLCWATTTCRARSRETHCCVALATRRRQLPSRSRGSLWGDTSKAAARLKTRKLWGGSLGRSRPLAGFRNCADTIATSRSRPIAGCGPMGCPMGCPTTGFHHNRWPEGPWAPGWKSRGVRCLIRVLGCGQSGR